MSRKPMVTIIADALREAPTAEDKVKVLQKYNSDGLFKRIVMYAHNPLIQFGLDDFTPTAELGKEQGMGISKFMHLPEDISTNSLNNKEAVFAINMVLGHINEQEVDLFLGIFNKDLGLGLTSDIINTAWPDFIPDYPVMYPSAYNPEGMDKWPQIIIQQIPEGQRVNIIVRHSDVKFKNEHGEELQEFDQYKSQFLALAQSGRIVFDGVWNGEKFILFDSIRYDGFVEGKDNRLGYNWRYNGIEQMWFLSKIPKEESCFNLPIYMLVASVEDMKKEVTKLNKSCYLRSPAGTWQSGENAEWQLVTPDDVS